MSSDCRTSGQSSDPPLLFGVPRAVLYGYLGSKSVPPALLSVSLWRISLWQVPRREVSSSSWAPLAPCGPARALCPAFSCQQEMVDTDTSLSLHLAVAKGKCYPVV